MQNTYWNSNGTYQKLAEELQKLIPEMGDIKGSKNRQLERFRKAVNAYYDIFNNGGCNRGQSIGRFFGAGVGFHLRQWTTNWDAIHVIVEPVMDEIILAAAKEQNIC